jgi:hypothetical protein
MGRATRTRFGRRHSVGNNSPPAQHRYDFHLEHATHFRPVDVVCQGSNVVWSLPFPPLVRELPVRLTTKIRQPPARIDLDPVATPPALDRLRPAGPVQSVVQPPLLIPGHGHSRNYSRNHGAVKLPCGVWPPAPAFRSAGGAPAEPLVPPIKCRADGVMSHACHGRSRPARMFPISVLRAALQRQGAGGGFDNTMFGGARGMGAFAICAAGQLPDLVSTADRARFTPRRVCGGLPDLCAEAGCGSPIGSAGVPRQVKASLPTSWPQPCSSRSACQGAGRLR